jgi:hypothetical protein
MTTITTLKEPQRIKIAPNLSGAFNKNSASTDATATMMIDFMSHQAG